MSPTPSAHAGPLRMRLLLLAASGLLPLVIVLAWGVDHLAQERRSTAERTSLELSRALATAIDGELRSVAALLDQMGTSDELERAGLSRSRPPFNVKPTQSLRQLFDSGGQQGTGITTTAEGADVYTGFTRIADSGWIVAVGSSVAAANRAFLTLLSAIAIGLAASLGLALLLAWLLARRVTEPIEHLKEAAAA